MEGSTRDFGSDSKFRNSNLGIGKMKIRNWNFLVNSKGRVLGFWHLGPLSHTKNQGFHE